MITIEELRQLCQEKFGGLLYTGVHQPPLAPKNSEEPNWDFEGRACINELANYCATGDDYLPGDWDDCPSKSWDLRKLNDIEGVSDKLRAARLMPLYVQYQDAMVWSIERQSATAKHIVVETVRRIIALLPGLSDAARQRCHAVTDLDTARAAACVIELGTDPPAFVQEYSGWEWEPAGAYARAAAYAAGQATTEASCGPQRTPPVAPASPYSRAAGHAASVTTNAVAAAYAAGYAAAYDVVVEGAGWEDWVTGRLPGLTTHAASLLVEDNASELVLASTLGVVDDVRCTVNAEHFSSPPYGHVAGNDPNLGYRDWVKHRKATADLINAAYVAAYEANAKAITGVFNTTCDIWAEAAEQGDRRAL